MRNKLLLSALLSVAISGFACTTLSVMAADKSVVVGRTMEWAFPMDWKLVYYPKGTQYLLVGPDELKLPSVKMVSKYGVLGIGTGVAADALLEGQNDAGLGISGNFMPGFAKYQEVSKHDKKYLSVAEFVQFVLSNYATVDEVKKNIPLYKVWEPTLANSPERPTLHFMVTDRSDRNLVIEYVDGKLNMYDSPVGVMTNSPTYDWQLINLRNYINLSNDGRESLLVQKYGNVRAVGQGSGAIGLPADYTPSSRFVRTAFLNNYAYQPKTATEAVSYVDHILNNVDIPSGAVVSKIGGKEFADTTQWVVLKDITNNKLYFADYDHRTTFVKIDMAELGGKSFSVPIGKIQYPDNDVTAQFTK